MTQRYWKSILFKPAIFLLALFPAHELFAADPPITHQISLPGGQSWCDDSMINGLFDQINAFRTQKGVPVLTVSGLGMEDAEMRASQFATYMQTANPTAPGFNPHQGYDTTAASLGYDIVSENLAYITGDPAYIVGVVWQDSLHLAAMLSTAANVAGVSCVYQGGVPYWTYEPGACTGASCGTSTPPTPTPAPTPTGTPALDTEEWAFLTLINNYRAQNGLGPLQVDVELENAAQWMSNDMAANNYFSHTDSLGRSTGTRLAAFGYTYSPWGENLAAGFSAAQDAFNGWYSACDPDPSGNCTYAHRQNMLGSGYTAVGIARAYGSSSTYGWYWTTDFGGYVEQSIPTPTTNPPPGSAPVISSFTANPGSITQGGQATLSWSVSGATSITIDNGVGNVSTATSKTVSPAQTTTYTLTATNSTGASTAHATVTVTTLPTTTGPSTPVLTSATASGPTAVNLVWTASTSSAGIGSYQILRNGALLATVSGTTLSYADQSVSPGAAYSYSVRAVDGGGYLSAVSNSIQVAVPNAPASISACAPPAASAFTGCYYNNITLSGGASLVRTDPQINFDWGANSPDRSVSRGSFSVEWQGNFTFSQGTYTFSAVTSDGMRVYIDGNMILNQWKDQAPTMYSTQQTLSQGTHLITVEFYEESGSASAHLTWQGATPTVQVPSILSFTAAPAAITPGQQSTLSWSVSGASTVTIDNGVGDVTGLTSRMVQPNQNTTYTLTATNSAGSSTAKVAVTVSSAPDTQPPTPPVLTSAAAATSTEADLTWTAATDNIGIAGYQIIRNGTLLASVSGTTLSYADKSVTPGASYTYALQAYDAAGNHSQTSNSLQVTIPGTPVSSGSCPAPATESFTGCYYANLSLTGGPALVRTDPQINFDWGTNVPDRSLPRNGFSARWQGSFTFTQGTYTFTALTSDGMRLYIDGSLALDHWTNQAATSYTVSQSLTAGVHIITVEYYEATGWSTAHLSWIRN